MKAFDKAVELVIETPFRLNSLTEDLPVLREVSSLITCHVLRRSPSDSLKKGRDEREMRLLLPHCTIVLMFLRHTGSVECLKSMSLAYAAKRTSYKYVIS